MKKSDEAGDSMKPLSKGEENNEPNNSKDKKATKKPTAADKISRYIERNPKLLMVGWIYIATVFLLVLPAFYLFWFVLIPDLWSWTLKGWWHFLPAFFGFTVLFSIPIWVVMHGIASTNFLLDIYFTIDDSDAKEARETARETEEAAIQRFRGSDTGDLLELLKNSRTDLEAYYTTGINQSRRSFRNSVLAMWLGFILLLCGLAMYVAPVEQIGFDIPDPNTFNFLIIGGAAIIEFISALFLWVYRSTSVQLNNLYDREMYAHTVVLCYKIASTLKDPDESKKAIIEKVMDRQWSFGTVEKPGSNNFQKLITAEK